MSGKFMPVYLCTCLYVANRATIVKFGLVINIADAPNAGQDGVVAVIRAVHDKVAERTGLRLRRVA